MKGMNQSINHDSMVESQIIFYKLQKKFLKVLYPFAFSRSLLCFALLNSTLL